MKMYGNVINRLMENGGSVKPEVGVRVTEYMWSDRNVYEIVSVENDKHFKMIRMDAKNVGAGWGDNTWELSLDKNGYQYDMVFRYGQWYQRVGYTKEFIESKLEKEGWISLDEKSINIAREKGIVYKYSKKNIRLGVSDYYYDFEF